jgi:hypothetical protein
MSRNLFNFFIIKWNYSILIGFPIHFSYSYFSQKYKNIEVLDKYTFDTNGYTNFMIIDADNKHYKIGNNLWFWKWDSIEDFYNIKKGTKMSVLYYGYRVPAFGFFPNIIDTNYDTNFITTNSITTNAIKPLSTVLSCAK